MRTLETARVCIIDDEEKEYFPLIQALSRLRLGCVHISGERVEDLPDPPLSGLRLVFLDMQLGLEGADDAAITAHTAQVFSKVVSSSAGPLLVVVWTKHEDMVELFQKRLYEHYPEYLGKLLFTRIEKPADGADPNQLREAISLVMKNFYPAELLWRWEQLAHDAASATTEEISKLATERAAIGPEDSEGAGTTKLLTGLSEILLILISAEAEKTISSQTAFADLLAVLNPLHRDRLEHAVETPDAEVAEALVNGPTISPRKDEKIELNTMLFVAQHFREETPLRPGVLFGIRDMDSFQGRFRVSIGQVFGELLRVPHPPHWNDVTQRLKSGKLDIAQREKAEAELHALQSERDKIKSEWLVRCVPILLDISPPCDFAQRTPRLVRLLSGIMVPSDEGVIKRQSGDGAFRSIPTVRMEDPGGTWDLLFCSRFVFTVFSTDTVSELRPICRLRDPILTDIRAWCSTQDARLGYAFF